MSRVGKQPIPVPAGVQVRLDGDMMTVKGGNGELSSRRPPGISVEQGDGVLHVGRASDTARLRALHGTTRSLLANMVKGVHEGYRSELEIQGVGYRAQLQGQTLVLSLGFSHAIEFPVPPGVKIEVPDATHVTVSGPDKQQVGDVSARIRGYSPAEPYKGKGVRYKGEAVRRKAGKTVA